MIKYLIPVLFLFILGSCSVSQTDVNSTGAAKDELEQLLDEFLQGASTSDADMHDRFWAEDLIYTSSAGERIAKGDIMAGFESDTSASDTPATQYGYEDLQIMVFDDAAVVAFRLVGRSGVDDDADVMNFYNTGTFVKRNAQWKAVAWQATRIP